MAKILGKVPSSKQMQMDEAKKGECFCPKCPTYINCAKNAKELLFCMKGKSFMCIIKEQSCICPECLVTSEFGFNKFFCMKGAEKALRYEHALWGIKMV
jgi:hypothetical protein